MACCSSQDRSEVTGDGDTASSVQSCDGTLAQEQDSKKQHILSRTIMNFTPSWFVVNMGTGISSILLHELPYQFNGLRIIANVIFGLNVLLFTVFLAMSLARYIIWRKLWRLMLLHPTQSLFLGTFPMGFITIVNMCALSGVPAWGPGFATFTWTLWWIDIVVALAICVGVPFLQITRHDQSLEKITGVWFLPVVSTIVAAASGGIVANILPPAHARLTLIVSYIIFGTGFTFACFLMALYLARLYIYKIPAATIIVSGFNPVGPCGQGAFAILKLSSQVYKLAQDTGNGLERASAVSPTDAHIMATAIYGASIPLALVVYGLGMVWLLIAIFSFFDLWKVSRLPFNIGWWSLTFPLGVFCTATTQFARELDSNAFKIIGTILSIAEVFIWLAVFTRTSYAVCKGQLIFSPCLAEVGGKPPVEIVDSRKYAYEARESKVVV